MSWSAYDDHDRMMLPPSGTSWCGRRLAAIAVAGSRQNGWELLWERLKNVRKPEGPRLFVFDHCRQFIRTVPVLPVDAPGSPRPSPER